MTAKDGIPFAKFCTSNDLRRAIQAMGFKQALPTSVQGIRNIVLQYSNDVRNAQVKVIGEMKSKGQKFCITFDEWTSSRRRRYMNIFLSTENALWNLGLLPIKGSLTSDRAVGMVESKLKIYNLGLKEDIVCVVTDGTNSMKKIARLIPCQQQLCLAHAIQLAVTDVLYKKEPTRGEDPTISEPDSTDSDELSRSDSESDEDSNADEDSEFTVSCESDVSAKITHIFCAPVVQKVRKVVRIYRKSPLKSENLAKHSNADIGNELRLLIDSKSRWSSLYTMLKRFSKLQTSIMKSLIDLKIAVSFDQTELELITNLVEALEPVKVSLSSSYVLYYIILHIYI